MQEELGVRARGVDHDVTLGVDLLQPRRDLDTELAAEADQRTDIPADLFGSDVDGPDQRQVVALGDQPCRCAADGPQSVLDHPNHVAHLLSHDSAGLRSSPPMPCHPPRGA